MVDGLDFQILSASSGECEGDGDMLAAKQLLLGLHTTSSRVV